MTHDRRTFFGVGGTALLCSLAGRNVLSSNKEADLSGLASQVPDPPSLRSGGATAHASQVPSPAPALH